MGLASSKEGPWWEALNVEALPPRITRAAAKKLMGHRWDAAAEAWWKQRSEHCGGIIVRDDLLHELRWRRVSFVAATAAVQPAPVCTACALPHPWCDDKAAAAADRCTAAASPPPGEQDDDAWLALDWLFGAMRAADELGPGSPAIGRAAAALVAAPAFLPAVIGAGWWSLAALQGDGEEAAAAAQPRVDMLKGCGDGGFPHDALPTGPPLTPVMDTAAEVKRDNGKKGEKKTTEAPAAQRGPAGLSEGEREWTVRDEQGFCDELLVLLERWLQVHGSLLPGAGAGAGAPLAAADRRAAIGSKACMVYRIEEERGEV